VTRRCGARKPAGWGKVVAEVRLPRVVARAALITALASIVFPGFAGSRTPSAPETIDSSAFTAIGVDQSAKSMTTPFELDPSYASDGSLAADTLLREPRVVASAIFDGRPDAVIPAAQAIIKYIWHLDNNISWYGPGFYGHDGACGMFGADGLQADDIGVAHRTLPCGTKVTFKYLGYTVTTYVKDRGPYVSGRQWDMTKGLCLALHHCFTGGGVYWRID
jgi:hypothetical protein